MTTISISDLDIEKARLFYRTFLRVLASKKSEETFAQIIDGLPTQAASMRIMGDYMRSDIDQRIEPSEVSVRTFREFLKKLETSSIHVQAQVAQSYQNAEVDSEEFKLRLLELTAVAIHDLAGRTFKEFHPNGPPYHPDREVYHGYVEPDFFHPGYQCYYQYPQGDLDVVGYWAEGEIFGGPVVFEHDDSDDKILNAFINPPYLYLFEISNTQLNRLTAFSKSDLTPGDIQQTEGTVPFTAEEGLRTIDDDIGVTPQIYRDKYERTPKIRHESCIRPMTLSPEQLKWAAELPGHPYEAF